MIAILKSYKLYTGDYYTQLYMPNDLIKLTVFNSITLCHVLL